MNNVVGLNVINYTYVYTYISYKCETFPEKKRKDKQKCKNTI